MSAPGTTAVPALTEAVAPEAPVRPRTGARARRVGGELRAWVGLIPFFAFLGVFLIVPTVSLFVDAFAETEGSDVPAMREAMSGTFRRYFVESLKLSVVTAVLGGVTGTLLALVVARLRRPRWLRTLVTAWSGVAANMGGIILAFMFIAALGTQGLATKIVGNAGIRLPVGFITGFWGMVTVYLYFQIPLMFLVMVPAVDGLKQAWREAVANLGGTALTYWRRVGIPILAPAALGGTLLLLANAFAAYATAYSLSTGAAQLVSVQIRFYLQGNVITGKANLGYALAAWMIVLMLVTIGVYLLLRRRVERWQR